MYSESESRTSVVGGRRFIKYGTQGIIIYVKNIKSTEPIYINCNVHKYVGEGGREEIYLMKFFIKKRET